TDYQLALYRRLLTQFTDLEFLGIWHSHHPNGLRDLSDGDERTANDVVNSSRHTLDFLLSSLAFDESGLAGGRHFVFCLGHGYRYKIEPASGRVVGGPNGGAHAPDTATREMHTTLTARPTRPAPDVQAPPT